MNKLTPVEKKGDYYFKRDDKFKIGDQCGGKVRTCYALAKKRGSKKGLATAGSRSSPQVLIVSTVAKKLKIPCRVHVPKGELGETVQKAKDNGAKIIQHFPGYNTVIIARSKKDAEKHDFLEIPFGMECEEAVIQTKKQVKNIPNHIKRIVVPVGSGMSLCGILHGIVENKLNIKVKGIVVGADPVERLDKYAPKGWRKMVKLVNTSTKYEEYKKDTIFEDIDLDPIYEAKCIPYMKKGDLLWIVGRR